MLKINTCVRLPLFGVDATRQIEQAAQRSLPNPTLMQRAGLALAQLALATTPHANTIWIACGPGNNGGDGLEAAMHLQLWGKRAVVTWLGSASHAPQDALASHARAVKAGVTFAEHPPESFDLGIDALLGIGATERAPDGRMADWIQRLNASAAPVLAADLPTGLDADTGRVQAVHVKACLTLSFLTLKPGLFTAHGRDAAGAVWLADLDIGNPAQAHSAEPTAWLSSKPAVKARPHASHKGSFGDVAIIGGACGMTGAALLAASAALHAGAGRVFVGLLDPQAMQLDTSQPELMFRPIETLDFDTQTVVCGCGGGSAIGPVLHRILTSSSPVVVDADALNAIAVSAPLQALLTARGAQNRLTVLTPHPLEAARLNACSVQDIQHNRLLAAQQIAERFNCVVVLKGSGSVIAAPGEIPFINPTGNAKLAAPGTGDVLAGMIGAQLAAGESAFQAACQAVYAHGEAADLWPKNAALSAGALARSL